MLRFNNIKHAVSLSGVKHLFTLVFFVIDFFVVHQGIVHMMTWFLVFVYFHHVYFFYICCEFNTGCWYVCSVQLVVTTTKARHDMYSLQIAKLTLRSRADPNLILNTCSNKMFCNVSDIDQHM